MLGPPTGLCLYCIELLTTTLLRLTRPGCSINSRGEVGPMSRPGRPGQSCACGALIKAWQEIRSEGLMCNCKIPGGEGLSPVRLPAPAEGRQACGPLRAETHAAIKPSNPGLLTD